MNENKVKIRTGVALDDYIVKELDSIVQTNKDLGLTRSEIINAILHSYIKSDHPQQVKIEKLREYIIKIRKEIFKP